MSTRDRRQRLLETLKELQRLEDLSAAHTAAVVERTRNPVSRLVMEIIQRDSAMHHRVQQLVIDSIEREPVTLTAEDLEQVWVAVEAHIRAERRTGRLVAGAGKALAGTGDVVPHYLLSYLGHDEQKHDRLLDDLARIRRGLYRSAKARPVAEGNGARLRGRAAGCRGG